MTNGFTYRFKSGRSLHLIFDEVDEVLAVVPGEEDGQVYSSQTQQGNKTVQVVVRPEPVPFTLLGKGYHK
jgi:hypothetical protein